MIITIDGPAGAGKSTVAKRLAERLGFEFLNTGGFYRAIALAALRKGIDVDDKEAVAQLARRLDVRQENGRILLDGEDVTEEIRSVRVTAAVPAVADNELVRLHLKKLQRAWAENKHVVTEGRDQGTEVFPDAQLKFFLTASPEERARRRYEELKAKNEPVTYEQVFQQLLARDRRDQTRRFGRLRRPSDAVEIDTDGLTIDQVVARLERIARERLKLPPKQGPNR